MKNIKDVLILLKNVILDVRNAKMEFVCSVKGNKVLKDREFCLIVFVLKNLTMIRLNIIRNMLIA